MDNTPRTPRSAALGQGRGTPARSPMKSEINTARAWGSWHGARRRIIRRRRPDTRAFASRKNLGAAERGADGPESAHAGPAARAAKPPRCQSQQRAAVSLLFISAAARQAHPRPPIDPEHDGLPRSAISRSRTNSCPHQPNARGGQCLRRLSPTCAGPVLARKESSHSCGRVHACSPADLRRPDALHGRSSAGKRGCLSSDRCGRVSGLFHAAAFFRRSGCRGLRLINVFRLSTPVPRAAKFSAQIRCSQTGRPYQVTSSAEGPNRLVARCAARTVSITPAQHGGRGPSAR